MNIENNIPAFPRARSVNHSDSQDGMTLLDYFAGQAIGGAIGRTLNDTYNITNNIEGAADDIAGAAYAIAAAMLRQRQYTTAHVSYKPLALAEHIESMADDAYLKGHPEWLAIVEEARLVISNSTR